MLYFSVCFLKVFYRIFLIYRKTFEVTKFCQSCTIFFALSLGKFLFSNSRLVSMEVKGGAVEAGDILDLIVIQSQKGKGQRNVEDHELSLERILKDLVMQKFGGKMM